MKVHFSRHEGWFKVQMRLQRCGMCLISALINTNIEAMKRNMEGNSAEQPLLTWSKMRGSLFYPNLTLSLRAADTNANAERLMVSGCSVLPRWTCALPAPPSQWRVFCQQFPNFDLCCLAVIWWSVSEAGNEGDWVNIRHWHFSVIRHHRGHIESSRYRWPTCSPADPLRDTHNSPNLTSWTFKTPFWSFTFPI